MSYRLSENIYRSYLDNGFLSGTNKGPLKLNNKKTNNSSKNRWKVRTDFIPQKKYRYR